MKSALLVSSLLVGAQAFVPSMPARTSFLQSQGVRAEPVRAGRGRGGECSMKERGGCKILGG